MSTVMPVPLVPAGWDQLDQVMAVMECSFDPEFGEAWTRAQCGGILPMQGVRMTLAGEPNKPVGFSLLRAVADETELLLLAVAPQARRAGVGSALVSDFIEHARTAGARRVHLEVRDGNPAVELYRRHLFTVEGRRPNYYRGSDGRRYDALTMSRHI